MLYQLMAEERGLQVDVEGFNNTMDEARERSRNAQDKVLHSPFVNSLLIYYYYSNELFGLRLSQQEKEKNERNKHRGATK